MTPMFHVCYIRHMAKHNKPPRSPQKRYKSFRVPLELHEAGVKLAAQRKQDIIVVLGELIGAALQAEAMRPVVTSNAVVYNQHGE